MRLGDTFLMPVPLQDCDHLWIVISDPEAYGGTFVIVNVTGDYFRAGKECVLGPKDHPWIAKECFVTFADALEITPQRSAHLDQLVGKLIKMQGLLEKAALERIIGCAKKSRAFPTGYKKYL